MCLLQLLFVAVITWSILPGKAVSESVNYTSFSTNVINDFFLFNNASIALESLQVTPETTNSDFSLANRSGRIIYRRRYRVWKRSPPGNIVASFNSTFVMNIQAIKGSGGEGLAFIIASSIDIPAESDGKWLGLFNSSTNGNTSNKLVAVEFDTKKSAGTNDPDGNHVGIDVNSINSTNFTSLDPAEFNLTAGDDIRAWIQYDGNQKNLRVYLANASESRPADPILSYPLDLVTEVDQNVYFGFSASTGTDVELNCIKSWALDIEPVTSGKKPVLIIALSVVAAALVVASAGMVVLFVKYRKARAEAKVISGALQNLPGQPREFKYKLLKKATADFSPKSKLGSGAFGAVYKAVLPKEKSVVAVKRTLKDTKQGKEEFVSEIRIINQLRHRNLVPLLGWCHDKGHLMMVYEYMPNGSLEKHIYQGFLDWEQRYKIVSGVASALLYLHEECEQQVVHRDVKASNIMLDSDYNARLGDFGLARLLEHDRGSYTATDVAGTMGYIAPECFHTGRATVESDVYSFGAVALEVACGRAPRLGLDAPELVGWVWNLYRENRLMDAADCRLSMKGNVEEEDIRRLMMVGLACSNPNPGSRPTMRQVKQILGKDMPPPFVPLFRPPFVWPYPFADSTSFATTSVNTETSLLSSVGNQSFIAEWQYRQTFSDIDL